MKSISFNLFPNLIDLSIVISFLMGFSGDVTKSQMKDF